MTITLPTFAGLYVLIFITWGLPSIKISMKKPWVKTRFCNFALFIKFTKFNLAWKFSSFTSMLHKVSDSQTKQAIFCHPWLHFEQPMANASHNNDAKMYECMSNCAPMINTQNHYQVWSHVARPFKIEIHKACSWWKFVSAHTLFGIRISRY